MVKFLLDAGADQDHKTDEMHTALMEASMDGHVEVARLLLDHGAQVCHPLNCCSLTGWQITTCCLTGFFYLHLLLISCAVFLYVQIFCESIVCCILVFN